MIARITLPWHLIPLLVFSGTHISLICTVNYSIVWIGHWFWHLIAPFTWYGHTNFEYWFLLLIWGARRVGPVGRGCLLLHLAPDLTSDIFRGPCTLILGWFLFPIGLMRLITVRYFCHFIDKGNHSSCIDDSIQSFILNDNTKLNTFP
jgi:hypothetical protein